MRCALASLVILGLAGLMLAVRGSADWSQAFAALWYLTFGAAVVLALFAVVIAIAARGATSGYRVLAVVLALPALIAAPLLIWIIATVAPLSD